MDRTFQTIRDEAAATSDAARLWKLSQEIGTKFKRNADKAAFVGMMPGGAEVERDWLNKASGYWALCAEVSAMVAKALAGKSTQDILAIAEEGAR